MKIRHAFVGARRKNAYQGGSEGKCRGFSGVKGDSLSGEEKRRCQNRENLLVALRQVPKGGMRFFLGPIPFLGEIKNQAGEEPVLLGQPWEFAMQEKVPEGPLVR